MKRETSRPIGVATQESNRPAPFVSDANVRQKHPLRFVAVAASPPFVVYISVTHRAGALATSLRPPQPFLER